MRLQEKFREAVEQFQAALGVDPENVTAHYNLQLLYERLGNQELSAKHQRLHERYKPDDNAEGRAVRLAREKYPAANQAAEAVVKYSLFREGAPGLEPPSQSPAMRSSRLMSNREDMDTQYEEDLEYRDDAIIGQAFRWSLAAILLLIIVGGTTAYMITRPEPEPPVRETRLAPVKVREVRGGATSHGDLYRYHRRFRDRLCPQQWGNGRKAVARDDGWRDGLLGFRQ